MRKLLLILIALMAVSSQAASTYFISAHDSCTNGLSAKQHDVKILITYDTISRESTMVCSNECKWQYSYTIHSAYSISYLTDFAAILKVSYSFFDSLNREFLFAIKVPNSTVDSIWGDTMSLPGYNKTLYARISVPNVRNIDYLSMSDSFTIIGTLKQNANVSFADTLVSGPLSSNCSEPTCGLSDSSLPQGKWNWIYTENSVCGLSRCSYSYTDPSSLGANYSYVFSNDSVYAYQDTTVRFIDTIDFLSLCSRSIWTQHPLSFPQTSIGCRYSYIGDKVLCLTPITTGSLMSDSKYYFLSSSASIDSFLTKTAQHLQLPNAASRFSIKELSNRNLEVAFDLSRASNVSLTLYSMSGKLVSNLFKRYQSSGRYEYTLKMPVLPAGCYLLVLKKGDQVASARLNYVR